MAKSDIRIPFSFLNHRKRKKLERILGKSGTSHLIDLWLNSAMNHPSGILDGMTKEDIALDANWDDDEEKLIDAFIHAGFLDVLDNGTYALHDWDTHQPWVCGSEERSERARKAVSKRWEKEKDTKCIRDVYEQNSDGNSPSLPTITNLPTNHICENEKTNLTQIQQQTIKVIETWNKNTSGSIRTKPPSPSHVDTIHKHLKKDPNWIADYLEAAPLFKDVDDSGWSSGSVSFPWSIRFKTPSDVIGGRYKKPESKETPQEPRKTIFELNEEMCQNG